MYCIDILTPTGVGYGYTLGTWGEANVTNVGHVALLLGQYYPNTALPTIGVNGINNVADQAAAVQAAIWYFSDNYVLAPGDPLLPAVTAIVNAVRVQTPAPAPTPPTPADHPAADDDRHRRVVHRAVHRRHQRRGRRDGLGQRRDDDVQRRGGNDADRQRGDCRQRRPDLAQPDGRSGRPR